MTVPTYTIHIACFNNLELTRKCLASVMQHSKDYELIVTDNASTDGTVEHLQRLKQTLGPRLTIITNTTNQGFKEPCNHALTLAKGELFVLLNNDMEVCEGWLEALAEPLANPKVGITGLAGMCSAIDKNLHGYPNSSKVEYVEGSCLMLPTWLARRVGLFASYLHFAYWEDTDLSLRVRELGYELATMKLPMTHERRGSTSKTVPEVADYLADNTRVMREKWGFYWNRRDLKRRILVRRLGARGDVLLATPALAALRAKYPHAEIGVVTKCPEMLRGLDWLTIATKRRSYYDEFYDLDLAYEKRPEVHIVHAFADVLGVELPVRWQLLMVAGAQDELWADRVSRGARVALVHAGPTCWEGKNWPLPRFEALVQGLKGRGYFTIAVGAPDSPTVGCDLSVAGLTTPQALYALAKQASLFVGLDSMCQHVASAANTPSVVLFGPTNPRCIVRPTMRILPMQGDAGKVPCVGEHGRRLVPVTSAPCDGACMRAITVSDVMRAVGRVEALVA